MYTLFGESASLMELYGEDAERHIGDLSERYGISPAEALTELMGSPYLLGASKLQKLGDKIGKAAGALPGITSGLSQGKAGVTRGFAQIQAAIKGTPIPSDDDAPPQEPPNLKVFLIPALSIAGIILLKVLAGKKKGKKR